MYQVGYESTLQPASYQAGQWAPVEFALGTPSSSGSPAAAADGVALFPSAAASQSSAVQSQPGGLIAGFGNIINYIFSMLQNFMNSLGGSGQTPATEQMFSQATLSSTGDPHDALTGTTGSGQSLNNHWDNMQAHANLLDSDSFNGGYQASTQVTTPNANGVTLNSSATITTNDGQTSVTLDGQGNATLNQAGQQVALQAGQTYVLGNGETVVDNSDGSLSVSDQNGQGGSLTTTLKTNGSGGVDVSASANNADLGGYLVTQSDSDPGVEQQPVGFAPPYQPIGVNPPYQPIEQLPIAQPIYDTYSSQPYQTYAPQQYSDAQTNPYEPA